MNIFDAIRKKDFETFKSLIDSGADVLAVNSAGKAPIFVIIENGYLEMAEYLLGHTNVAEQMSLTYNDYYSPVLYALKYHKCEMVKKFFIHDPSLSTKLDEWGDTYLTSTIYNVAKYNRDGDHIKADIERQKLKCLLVVSDYDAADKYGNTPLTKALWEGDVPTIYDLFLLSGDKINKNAPIATSAYDTPLTKAIYMQDHDSKKSKEVVAALLKICVDPYVPNGRDELPIDVALRLGDPDIINMLSNYIKSNHCNGDYTSFAGFDV